MKILQKKAEQGEERKFDEVSWERNQKKIL